MERSIDEIVKDLRKQHEADCDEIIIRMALAGESEEKAVDAVMVFKAQCMMVAKHLVQDPKKN